MSADNAHYVRAGKCGLMDMLAGGHVDDATFGHAIELLRAEDWEALRLLLAGEALHPRYATQTSYQQDGSCCQPHSGTSIACLLSRCARKPALPLATQDRCRESTPTQTADECGA